MTDGVTRTDVDKTMWLVTLADIITNNSTRQEDNLVVILSREESWGLLLNVIPTRCIGPPA